jgi:hypothetical protein
MSWSQQYGQNGGHTPYLVQNQNYSLVGVRGRFGDVLDSIQFLFIDITTGQYHESPKLGGNGGEFPFNWQCTMGQWIDKVHIRCGGLVDAL